MAAPVILNARPPLVSCIARLCVRQISPPVTAHFSLVRHCTMQQSLTYKLHYAKSFMTVAHLRPYSLTTRSKLWTRTAKATHIVKAQCKMQVQCASYNTQARVQTVATVISRTVTQKADVTSSEGMAKGRGIQKDVLPLTSKRVMGRKRTKDASPRDQAVFDVTAYATAEEIHLESLKRQLQSQGLYSVIPLPSDVTDALHLEAQYRVDDEPREIFFFREGSVVFWNMPEVEREAVLRSIKRFQVEPYDPRLVRQEYEPVQFAYSKNTTRLVEDEIQFQKEELRPEEEVEMTHQLEKYTFSNALSLSVKLSIWEASLAKYVDSIEDIVEDLKEGRKVRCSEADMLRKAGEIYTLKHLINLSSDLLDTPDFYWDRNKLEMLYNQTRSYLNIRKRTRIMNERLNLCLELTGLVTEHLKDKHHTRLEWMIIILILVEVLFEMSHMKIVQEQFGKLAKYFES